MADDTTTQDPMRVQLRRYPNRRYYDAARSQHLTLEDIFQLVCEGHQVQVNDSKSGEDITVRVLAQLILEQAPGKLAALPAELLHQIIRSNESLLRDFIDKYFYRALSAFIESQREFDRYLRQVLGLNGPDDAGSPNDSKSAGQSPRGLLPAQSFPFLVPDWTRMMMGPFARALLSAPADAPGAAPERQRGQERDNDRDGEQGNDQSDVRKAVAELKQEVDALRKELNRVEK